MKVRQNYLGMVCGLVVIFAATREAIRNGPTPEPIVVHVRVDLRKCGCDSSTHGQPHAAHVRASPHTTSHTGLLDGPQTA